MNERTYNFSGWELEWITTGRGYWLPHLSGE